MQGDSSLIFYIKLAASPAPALNFPEPWLTLCLPPKTPPVEEGFERKGRTQAHVRDKKTPR